MTNNSVFNVDYLVVFYIHSSTMMCLNFLWTIKVWILCFSDLQYVICGFLVCFMTEIVLFYDFVHFVGKMDFVAEPHPLKFCTKRKFGQKVPEVSMNKIPISKQQNPKSFL
ncbi:hypothetical protein Hanom_Chr06g00529201 [Helianthus anomalus]